MSKSKKIKGKSIALTPSKKIQEHIQKFDAMKLERINSNFCGSDIVDLNDDNKNKSDKKDEHIRVIVRFRPCNKGERQYEKDNNIDQTEYEPEIIHDNDVHVSTVTLECLKSKKPMKKTFDYIFKSDAKQRDVFKKVGVPMIKNCLDGFNSTIFAYGQTGSGKTYSMFGQLYEQKQWGIVPSCIQYLFQKLNKKLTDNGGNIHMFKVTMQTLQIYKDQLLDLLNPNSKQSLAIKCDFRTDEVFVQNLKTTLITSVKEALGILVEAESNRIVASHKLNSTSSRSHMLVMISVEQVMNDGSVKSSKLNFGDLAGSEDITKALGKNADPEMLKQAIGINKSLSALTTAIKFLSENKRPSYRSSPLTHVLKDSLGGNSKTIMFIACSPHYYNRNETIRTLRFATQAKKVQTHAKKNKQESRKKLLARIKELQVINEKLRMEIDLERQKNEKLQTRIELELQTPAISRRPSVFGTNNSVENNKKTKLETNNSYTNEKSITRIQVTGPDDDTKKVTFAGDNIMIPIDDDELKTEYISDMDSIPTPKHIRDVTRMLTNDLGKIDNFLGKMDNLDKQISTGFNENEQLKEEIKRKDQELDDFSNKLIKMTYERNNFENDNIKLTNKNEKLLDIINQYKNRFPDFKIQENIDNIDGKKDNINDINDNKYDNTVIPPNQQNRSSVSLSKSQSMYSNTSFDVNSNTLEARELTNFLNEMKKKVNEQYKEMVKNNTMLLTTQAQQQLFSGYLGYYNPTLLNAQHGHQFSNNSGNSIPSLQQIGSFPPQLQTINSNPSQQSSMQPHTPNDGTMLLNNNYPIKHNKSRKTGKYLKHYEINSDSDSDIDIDNNNNNNDNDSMNIYDNDGTIITNSNVNSIKDTTSTTNESSEYITKSKRKKRKRKRKKRRKNYDSSIDDKYLKKIEFLERQIKMMNKQKKEDVGSSCWLRWFG